METWLAAELTDLSGNIVRFGSDEADAGDIPQGISFDTQLPGGFHTASLTLSRPPQMRADDMKLFRDVRIYGAGGVTAYEGRVHGVPQVDVTSIQLEMEGHSAALDDDESLREIWIDRDLGNWGEASIQRNINIITNGGKDHLSVEMAGADSETGTGIVMHVDELDPNVIDVGDAWYYGGGIPLGKMRYDFDTVGTAVTTWLDRAYLSTDDVRTSSDAGTDHANVDATNQTVTATTTTRKYAEVTSQASGGVSGDKNASHIWKNVAVIGLHGLTERGTWPAIGFYASDLISDVIGRWTGLNFTTGSNGSIEDSSFLVSQLVATEPTTAREIVERISAYGTSSFLVPDWGCWEGKQFFWRSPGSYGRTWRIRRDQVATPISSGPDSARRCGAVFVTYQNANGETFSAGPPGSGATVESASLQDTDPQNPASQITRHRDVGITYAEGALQLGQVLLQESNRIRWRGSVKVQGDARDDKGNTYPSWMIRAGDRVLIEDEPEPEEMPVASTSYSHDDMTCDVTIGELPDRLDVVLSRLG